MLTARNCGKRSAKLLKNGEMSKHKKRIESGELKITEKQENDWKIDGRKAGRFPVFEEIYQPLMVYNMKVTAVLEDMVDFFQQPYILQTTVN